MSSICKNNYNNYGSYLRSRGYNEQICNLVNDLNNGNVVLGSVVPNGTDGVTLKGTVNINNATGSNGYLVYMVVIIQTETYLAFKQIMV